MAAKQAVKASPPPPTPPRRAPTDPNWCRRRVGAPPAGEGGCTPPADLRLPRQLSRPLPSSRLSHRAPARVKRWCNQRVSSFRARSLATHRHHSPSLSARPQQPRHTRPGNSAGCWAGGLDMAAAPPPPPPPADAPLDVEAAGLITQLRLTPHPEGGFYRETYRDPGSGSDGRAHRCVCVSGAAGVGWPPTRAPRPLTPPGCAPTITTARAALPSTTCCRRGPSPSCTAWTLQRCGITTKVGEGGGGGGERGGGCAMCAPAAPLGTTATLAACGAAVPTPRRVPTHPPTPCRRPHHDRGAVRG